MSDEIKKLHTRVRTFADDLNTQRGKSKPAATTVETKSVATVPVPVPKKTGGIVSEPRMNHIHVPDKVTPYINSETETDLPDPDNKIKSKIPAFHELQKKSNLIKETEELKTTPIKEDTEIKLIKKNEVPEPKKSPRVNIGYDSTVITDTKSKNFSLLAALKHSIKSWFHTFNANRKKKSTPKYSVAEANHRKGVIQKATSKSGATFTGDNETIKEQIRKRRQEAELHHEPETTWSPNTETGYNLLEAPEQLPDVTSNVVVQYKQNVTADVPKTISVPELPISPREVESTNTSSDLIPTPIEPSEKTELPEPLKENKLTVRENPPTQESTLDSDKDYSHQLKTTTFETQQKAKIHRGPSGLLNIDTNILTITIVIMVTGFVIILLAAHIINRESKIESTVVENTLVPRKSIINNSKLTEVTLSRDSIDNIPKLIDSSIKSSPMGMVEISIVSQTGAEITPSYLFGLLRFQTLPNLRQSITATRFATIDQSKPIIVMSFIDENTVRGGLLSWEKTMASDMRALYNIPMDTASKFTDDSIGDVDVRILRHNNEILLIYGIINDHTLIVVSKVSDFAQIVEFGFSD